MNNPYEDPYEDYDGACIDCSGAGGFTYKDEYGWYGETCDLCGGSGYMPAPEECEEQTS
jgi:hypothetical protein